MGDQIVFGRTQTAIQTPFDNSTNGFTSVEVQSAIEEVKATAPGLKARMNAKFGYKGVLNSVSALEYYAGVASDIVGWIAAESGTVKSFSVGTKNNETCTFTVYKNGSSIGTLSLSAARKNNLAGLTIAFVALDEIHVEITSGNARDIAFNIMIQVGG